MSKTFRSWDVDQPLLLAPSVHDLVPSGHLAHFIRDTVRESLDLSAIVGAYVDGRGYPPYHPVMMTALLLYAYCQGITSSRRIARSCEERVDFMAVTAHQTPDFRTISDFRKRHLKALGELFGQVVGLCAQAGLVKLGHVALDGTKLHANASKHKAMSYGRMKQKAPELAAEIAQWFAQAEATDGAEDEEFGADRRGDELPDWVRHKQQRLAKMQKAMAALEAQAAAEAEDASEEDEPPDGPTGGGAPSKQKRARGKKLEPPSKAPPDKAQRNFTDPDSRIMKDSKGFEQCYNAQAAVDADSQVIVAEGLTNSLSDRRQIVPMLEAIEQQTGRKPRELSADNGYCSEANLAHLVERGVRGYIATGKRPSRQTHVRAMSRRLKRGGHRSRYRLRKQTVEPVFGQIKAARGFRQFLLRGLGKVRDEWRLVCIAHNLLKLASARRPVG